MSRNKFGGYSFSISSVRSFDLGAGSGELGFGVRGADEDEGLRGRDTTANNCIRCKSQSTSKIERERRETKTT